MRSDKLVKIRDDYMYISGEGLCDIEELYAKESTHLIRIINTKAWQFFKSKYSQERCEEPTDVGGGFPAYPFEGADRPPALEGLMILRLSNVGNVRAEQIIITADEHTFLENGEVYNSIWEIDSEKWNQDSLSADDLKPGEEILVPIAHLHGVNVYFGDMLLPDRISWQNVFVPEDRGRALDSIEPADQWILRNSELSYAQ